MLMPDSLGTGLRCVKYLLVAFNILFAVSGILLVVAAVLVGEPLSKLTPLLDTRLLSPAVLLGISGAAVTTVSCFGVLGALRHSTVLVTTFAMLLSLLLFLELGAGVAAYLMQNGLRNMLFENIWTAMHSYEDTPDIALVIDRMQSGLACCGVMDPSDWLTVRQSPYLPVTCCDTLSVELNNGTCTLQFALNNRPGCLKEMGLLVVRGSAFIASTAIVTACTQFLGILFACSLGCSIRHQKTLRELHRAELRDRLINTYSPVNTKPITIRYCTS